MIRKFQEVSARIFRDVNISVAEAVSMCHTKREALKWNENYSTDYLKFLKWNFSVPEWNSTSRISWDWNYPFASLVAVKIIVHPFTVHSERYIQKAIFSSITSSAYSSVHFSTDQADVYECSSRSSQMTACRFRVFGGFHSYIQ